MTSSRNDLEQWILRARQVDSWPSPSAQARVWDAIERRIAIGPPPVSIGPVHVGGTISASKLMIVLAVVTSVGAPLVGGIAAARMLEDEAAAMPPTVVAARTEPTPVVVETAREPVVDDEGSIELFDEGPVDAEVEILDEPAPVRSTRVMRRTGGPSGSLAIETRILRSARAQLRAGDVDEAKESLAEHRERFPRGMLVDLRVALEIDASCRLGHTARAMSLATEFERRYPSSPYRVKDCQPAGGGQP